MDLQFLIVLGIIVVAIGFAGITFAQKTKGFSKKNNCASDCGCNGLTSQT